MEMIVIVNETEERIRVVCGKVCSFEIRIMMPFSGLQTITSLMKMEYQFKIKDIIHYSYV